MPQKPEPTLITIRTIHTALGLGVVLFFGVIIFLSFTSTTPPCKEPEQFLQILVYIAIGLVIVNSIIGPILFRITLEKAKAAQDDVFKNRYQVFLTSHIIRMALFEGSALFCAVSLFLYVTQCGRIVMIMETALCLAGLAVFFINCIIHFPTEYKIREALGLYSRKTE